MFYPVPIRLIIPMFRRYNLRNFSIQSLVTHDTTKNDIMQSSELATIIQQRQTWKVLAPVDQPVIHSAETLDAGDQKLTEAIAAAGWAPFHYDRATDGIAEPWRAHVLNQTQCRALAIEFPSLFADIKPTNKLPGILSACGSLVLVTWLPQFSHDAQTDAEELPKEKQIQVDEEHLAAASAFVQSLLLMLTAQELGPYWSSGGQFRTPAMFEHLKIPTVQRLLAAIFVDYDPQHQAAERIAGKHRESRADSSRWARWI